MFLARRDLTKYCEKIILQSRFSENPLMPDLRCIIDGYVVYYARGNLGVKKPENAEKLLCNNDAI